MKWNELEKWASNLSQSSNVSVATLSPIVNVSLYSYYTFALHSFWFACFRLYEHIERQTPAHILPIL